MKSIHDKEYQIFIDLLKEHRISKNLTQGELAKKLGWANHTYVSKYEILERRLDIIEFRKVCIALEIKPIEFMKEFEKLLEKTK